jgi:hypothetical protein
MSSSGNLPLIEALENRRLLSTVVGPIVGPILPTPPIPPVSISSATLVGNPIHAEANQAFKAALGSIQDLKLPTGYTLQGTINWGDGSPTSAATFVKRIDGTVEVVGSHTYVGVGSDPISVLITESNPISTTAAVVLVGTLKTTATVISSPGGVTLEETGDVPFTANVGSFSSNLSLSTMTAVINWGDGTSSIGRILATPVTPPASGADVSVVGGTFVVDGSHIYARSGSYVVHVSVTSRPVVPPPVTVTSTSAEPPIIIDVAEIDSVIDVLSLSPVAASL